MMTIKREELDRRKVDFSEVTTGQLLSPVHPGEILRDEFLIPMNLSVDRLAQAVKVSETDLDAIMHGGHGITIDIALRLGHYFGMTPEFWMNLQTRYDLDVAEHTVRLKIEREIEPYAALAPSPNSARQMDAT